MGSETRDDWECADASTLKRIFDDFVALTFDGNADESKAKFPSLYTFAESQGLTGSSVLGVLKNPGVGSWVKSMDARFFSYFYSFVFFLCRERSQKSIRVELAISAWQFVLNGRFRLLEDWCQFVARHQRHSISEDTWKQLFEFSKVIHEDLNNYDPQGAWPVLIDEFVECFCRRMYHNLPCPTCTMTQHEKGPIDRNPLPSYSSMTLTRTSPSFSTPDLRPLLGFKRRVEPQGLQDMGTEERIDECDEDSEKQNQYQKEYDHRYLQQQQQQENECVDSLSQRLSLLIPCDSNKRHKYMGLEQSEEFFGSHSPIDNFQSEFISSIPDSSYHHPNLSIPSMEHSTRGDSHFENEPHPLDSQEYSSSQQPVHDLNFSEEMPLDDGMEVIDNEEEISDSEATSAMNRNARTTIRTPKNPNSVLNYEGYPLDDSENHSSYASRLPSGTFLPVR